MAPVNSTRFGAELQNINFGGLIANMGVGIAKAQWELDQCSIRVAQMMAGADYVYDRLVYDEKKKKNIVKQEIMPGVKVLFGGQRLSLLELGFTPTFYQFTETLINVKMTLSMSYEESHEDAARDTSTDSISSSHSDSHSDYNRSASSGFLGLGADERSGATNRNANRNSNTSVNVSTMNEKNASKYSFEAGMTSEMSTKLVPIPPPAVLTERIQSMIKREMERKLEFIPNVVRLEKGETEELVEITLPDGSAMDGTSFPNVSIPVSSSTMIAVSKDEANKKIKVARGTITEPFRPEFVTVTVAAKDKNGKAVKGEFTVFLMSKD